LPRPISDLRKLSGAPGPPISVDTTLAEVARSALDAGAAWINDTAALGQDPALADLAAERGAPLVLMHRFEPPRRPGDAPRGRALVRRIADALAERTAFAVRRGVAPERIVLDPGVGVGTLVEDAVALHRCVEELRGPGRPLLFGTSRKSFLGELTGRTVGDRLAATAASVAWLAQQGVELLRVHDVAAMRDVVAVIDALRSAAAGGGS